MARVRGKHPSPSTAYYPDVVPSARFSDPHVFPVTPEKHPTNMPCRGSGGDPEAQEHPQRLPRESPPASKRSGAAQERHADTSRATTYYRPLVLRAGHTQRKGVKPTIPQECPREISRWFVGAILACAGARRQTTTTGIGGRGALTLTPCSSAPTLHACPCFPSHRQ